MTKRTCSNCQASLTAKQASCLKCKPKPSKRPLKPKARSSTSRSKPAAIVKTSSKPSLKKTTSKSKKEESTSRRSRLNSALPARRKSSLKNLGSLGVVILLASLVGTGAAWLFYYFSSNSQEVVRQTVTIGQAEFNCTVLNEEEIYELAYKNQGLQGDDPVISKLWLCDYLDKVYVTYATPELEVYLSQLLITQLLADNIDPQIYCEDLEAQTFINIAWLELVDNLEMLSTQQYSISANQDYQVLKKYLDNHQATYKTLKFKLPCPNVAP